MVYDTEHRKCHRSSPRDAVADFNDEADEKEATFQTTPSEEDLVEMMHFAHVTVCNTHTFKKMLLLRQGIVNDEFVMLFK